MALILAQPLLMVELFHAVGPWLLTFKPFCRILGRDMNKLPCFLAALAIGSCFCTASENDAYVCRLQSLTREFPIEVKEIIHPRWLRSTPLSVDLQVVPPSEKITVLAISADDVAFTDAKGNALAWSLDEVFGQSGDDIELNVYTVPHGEWVELKGNLIVKIGGDIVTQPGQTVKMGEKGKLDIQGCDISYKWDADDKLWISVSNSDVCMLEDFIFKTPSGEAVRIISSSQTLGDEEVSWQFEFEKHVKAVSVLAKTYSELQSVTVPVNMRIGFTGEIKSE